MSQGHMLADVVAIIGETLTQLHRSTHPTCSSLFCFFFVSVFLATGTQDIVFGEVDR